MILSRYSTKLRLILVSFIISNIIPYPTKADEISEELESIHNVREEKLSSEDIKYIEDVFDQAVKLLNVPGAVIAIVSEDKILLKKTVGVKKIDSDEKINDDTLFRIASVSKGFASFLIARIAQKGHFKLDDKISKYISDIKIGKNEAHYNSVSIRNILSQSTGFMPYAYENIIYGSHTQDSLFKKLVDIPVVSKPGLRLSYQNLIFSLVGPIAERTCNKSYEELLQEEIFGPLEMKNTTSRQIDLQNIPNVALPHINIKNQLRYQLSNSTSEYKNIIPAGGILSSLNDMIKWVQCIMNINGKMLDISLHKELFIPIVSANKKLKCKIKRSDCFRACSLVDFKYALGFYTKKYKDQKIVFHEGELTGYQSCIVFSPKHKLGMVVLNNSSTKYIHLPSIMRNVFEDIILGTNRKISNEQLRREIDRVVTKTKRT